MWKTIASLIIAILISLLVFKVIILLFSAAATLVFGLIHIIFILAVALPIYYIIKKKLFK